MLTKAISSLSAVWIGACMALFLGFLLLVACDSGSPPTKPPTPSEIDIAATEAAIMATKAAAHATLVAQECDEGTNTPTLTSTPTPMSTPSPTDTLPPPLTSTPTFTPTPKPIIAKVTSPKLNVRKGPGTAYHPITQVSEGDLLHALFRNEEATWIHVSIQSGQEGWVLASHTDIGDAIHDLPVDPNPPPKPKCRNGNRGLIAFKSSRGRIWVMNADGSQQMPMCNTNAYYSALNNKRSREYCSANGYYCVKDDWSPDRRHMDIYVLDNEYGSGWNRIVSNDHTDWGARIDPGGYWVVFVTNRNGNDELWMISREVSGERRLTINDWQWDKHPTWSPDGKRIAFFSNRNSGRKQIWVLDPNIPLKENVNPRNVSRNSYVDSDPVWLK